MAVRTGYRRAELSRLAARIEQQASTLVSELPAEPLQQLHLTCACESCIRPDAVRELLCTPPNQMTEDLVSAYFGGVAAVPSEQTEAARREARVIVTHVLALLGRMIVLPPEPARAMRRRLHYIDADYLLPYLLDTGFVPRLPTDTKTLIRSYLVDCTHYAIARALPDVGDVLVFLAIFTDALPEVLDAYRNGPPRRHLRFWAAMARGYVTKYDDRNRNGKDLHLSFRAMARSDRDRLLAALEAPEVEIMIVRYAVHAKDEAWLQYLSNLLDWREKTILATRHSTHRDGMD